MREIVQDGAPVLRQIAHEVPENLFDSMELKTLIHEMSELLDKKPDGMALAAPQVNSSYRIFIVRKDRVIRAKTQDYALNQNSHARILEPAMPEIDVYINPKIVRTSRRRISVDEGCLSVHGTSGTTRRHERVTLQAQKLDGTKFESNASGLMAQIFEHEIDHLNGILFTDHAEKVIRMPRIKENSFAYFGTPEVASETLAFLLKQKFVPALVVTAPDAPKGRGLAITPTPVKTLATERNIPFLAPQILDETVITNIKEYGCEYAVVVAYGKIFPEELIDSFPKGVLNVHYSLLPKYRGATPLESALLAGETKTGVTIQRMVKELDAGDILAQKATDIEAHETARELRPRLIELGAELLVETLPNYLNESITPVPQNPLLATYARKIKKEDGLLDLSAPAQENWNKYRAYAGSIGTYFFDYSTGVERRVKITRASLTDGKFVVERVVLAGGKEMIYTTKS